MNDKDGFEQLSITQMQFVDSRCVEFEDLRKDSGDTPAVRQMIAVMAQAPVELQSVVFGELLKIEIESLGNVSSFPNAETYLKAFPHRAHEINRQFKLRVGSRGDTTRRASTQSLDQESTKITRKMSAGSVIDNRYTIVERIGEGGMGTVYLAEQSSPVARKVAIKLIKVGFDSKRVLARFNVERSVLALMNHPGIARVFDGGQTEDGIPYFVMEFVRGVPLTTYCDEQGLTIRQRLLLLIDVCTAVQHAHLKGVIHRDLKPANILVSEVDGKPAIKIIDFGVAKAIDPNRISNAAATAEAILGTPVYMSPEQAVPGNVDIDMRADVYSLGVIFYELLTGGTPLTLTAESSDLLELLSQIRDSKVPRPSAQFENSQSRDKIAKVRQSNPKDISRLLKGDLDWISLKALEKERSRRYQTAIDLAQDVQRFLDNEAVEARPPSRAYQFRKFIARNKGAAIAASLLFVTLIAGIAGTTWGMYQARQQAEKFREETRQKEQALVEKQNALQEQTRQRAFAESITDFLEQDVLQLTSVYGRLEADVQSINEFSTLEDLLDRAVVSLDSRSDLSAEAEARLRTIIAESYRWRAASDKAVPQYERGVQLQRELYGVEDLRTIRSLRELGEALSIEGQLDRAFSLLEEAFETSKQMWGLENADTLICMGSLAEAHRRQGQYERAIAISEDCLKRTRDFFKTKNADTAGGEVIGGRNVGSRRILASMLELSRAYGAASRVNEAIETLEEALRLFEQDFGIQDPDVRVCRSELTSNYIDNGQFAKALPVLKDGVEWDKKTYGEKSREAMFSMVPLTNCVRQLGQTDLAIEMSQEILDIAEIQFGPEHLNYARAQRTLAISYRSNGNHELALPLFQSHFDTTARVFGENHRYTLSSMGGLISAIAAAGNLDQAIELGEDLLDRRLKILGEQDPSTFSIKENLAVYYCRRGELSRAIPLLEEVRQYRERRLGETHPSTLNVKYNLAVNYLDDGYPSKAIAMLESVRLNFEVAPTLKQTTLSTLFVAYLFADQHDQARDLLPEYFDSQKAQLSAKKPFLDASNGRRNKLMQRESWRKSLALIREWAQLNQKYAPEYSAVYLTNLQLGQALLRNEHYDEAEADLITAFEGLKIAQPSSAEAFAMATKNQMYAVQSMIQLKEATGDEIGIKQWKETQADLKAQSNTAANSGT